MPTDVSALVAELRAAGASPTAACEAARSRGLDRTATIRVLRELFRLTLAGARELLGEAPATSPHPPIDTRAQLLEVLRDELGYCDCAPHEALAVLVQFLRAARMRSDGTGDAADLAVSGLAHWFIYGLEQRGLVTHHFRVTDLWITDKGRWLLEAIERTAEH